MNIAEKLDGFDALVVVHPDCAPARSLNKNPGYLQNLADVTEVLIPSRKPIFVFPYYYNKEGNIPTELYSKWLLIPSFSYRTLISDERQKEVDFMATILKKEHGKIRLAAGGLNADWCVKFWLSYWCREVKINFESCGQIMTSSLVRPIGYGDIINELTDIGGNNGVTPCGSWFV